MLTSPPPLKWITGFFLILFGCQAWVADTHNRVMLQPLGNFSSSELAWVQQEVERFYAVDLVVGDPKPLPEMALYPPRQRYRADSLLRFLKDQKPDSVNFVVGLTTKDISTTKGEHLDWGVFGLGYHPGPSCVISTFRLRPSARNDDHFRERLSKVVLHEIGHNLGLAHCDNHVECLMRDARGKVQTVDAERVFLCTNCRSQILGFLPQPEP